MSTAAAEPAAPAPAAPATGTLEVRNACSYERVTAAAAATTPHRFAPRARNVGSACGHSPITCTSFCQDVETKSTLCATCSRGLGQLLAHIARVWASDRCHCRHVPTLTAGHTHNRAETLRLAWPRLAKPESLH